MNIHIKNCEVNIISGTETLEISGKAEPKTEIAGVIGTQRTYTLAGFMADKAAVQIGDRVKLPVFIVPETQIDGESELNFKEMEIDEYAVLTGKDKNGFLLKFERAPFDSAVDLNGETDFSKTQLGRYLNGAFKSAMNGAGIPADDCRLITKEEVFGENRLDFFKTGKNRVTFDTDEDCSRWCWLGTAYDDTDFCGVGNYGCASDLGAAYTGAVSPAFTIR